MHTTNRRRFPVLPPAAAAGLLLLSGCVEPGATSKRSARLAPTPMPAVAPLPSAPVAPAPPPSPALSRDEQLQQRLEQLRAQLTRAPYDWRNYNEVGKVLLELEEYRQAAAAFEQALTMHPIARTLDQERKAADQAKARADAAHKQQEQMRAAQEMAAANAMFSGLMGSMSMMPGAGNSPLPTLMPMIEGMNRFNEGMATAAATGAGSVNEETIESALPARQEMAGIWINLALAQSGYGDYTTAVGSAEKGFQIDPARYDALWHLSGIWREAGSAEKALAVLNRYVTYTSGKPSPPCCIRSMEIFRSIGMEDAAAAALAAAVRPSRDAVAAHPADCKAQLALGNFCMQGGLYDEAFAAYSAAYKLNPADPAAINGLAVSQLSLGRINPDPEWLGRLETQAATGANPSYAWYLIGRVQEESGNNAAAEAAYRKCVAAWEKSGSRPRDLGHVIVAYAGCGLGNRAMGCIEPLLDRQIGSSQASIEFFRIGLVYEKAGNAPEQAVEFYSLCLAGNPSYRPASLALQRLGAKHDAAVNAFLAAGAAALEKGDRAGAIAVRASALALLPPGMRKDALYRDILRLAAGADKLPPVSAEARDHWLRGNAIIKQAKSQKDIWRALLEYRQALLRAPWQSSLSLNVAACYGMLGRYDDAIRETRLYLEGASDPKVVEESRNKIYELEVQWKSARRELGGLISFR